MTRFPATRQWLITNGRLEPALLATRVFEDSIATRCRQLGLHARAAVTDEGDALYAEQLARDSIEAGRARSLVAVPETWLFRGRASFDAVRTRLATLAASGRRDVRLLSAGCANGAEPVSMAATALAAGLEGARCAVDAVDINPDVVEGAREARYRGMAKRERLPGWAEAWFTESDGVPVYNASPAEQALLRRLKTAFDPDGKTR